VPVEAYTFAVTGTVAVGTGKSRIYLEADYTHVAASCDHEAIQFFLDGTRFTVEPYTLGALLQPNELSVGGDNPDGSVADVDDLRLFDSPISATNVQWLYQNAGQYYDSTPTAFAAWGVPL